MEEKLFKLKEENKRLRDKNDKVLPHKISKNYSEKVKEKVIGEKKKVSFKTPIVIPKPKPTPTLTIKDETTPINNPKLEPDQKHIDDIKSFNVIIHGIKEAPTEPTANSEEKIVKDIAKTLGIREKFRAAMRIGKSYAEKNVPRPIKVIFTNKSEKDEMMRNLGKLRNTKYENVSVSDDYKYEERELLRKWRKLAKERNSEQQEYVWKLRGTPRSGLRLIKFYNDNNSEHREKRRTM